MFILLRNVFHFFGYLFAVLSGIFPDSGWASWLAGWENWMLSTLAGALYLFLEFTFQGAGNVPEFLAGGVNLVISDSRTDLFCACVSLKTKAIIKNTIRSFHCTTNSIRNYYILLYKHIYIFYIE